MVIHIKSRVIISGILPSNLRGLQSGTQNSSDNAALYTLSRVMYEDRKGETTGSICYHALAPQAEG